MIECFIGENMRIMVFEIFFIISVSKSEELGKEVYHVCFQFMISLLNSTNRVERFIISCWEWEEWAIHSSLLGVFYTL
jgi:hypothetical protein